ncbi:MAG: hypothetical protein WA510_24390, partial [Acidobacteriaceae bacterium]
IGADLVSKPAGSRTLFERIVAESLIDCSEGFTAYRDRTRKSESQFPLLKPKLHVSYPELQALAKL